MLLHFKKQTGCLIYPQMSCLPALGHDLSVDLHLILGGLSEASKVLGHGRVLVERHVGGVLHESGGNLHTRARANTSERANNHQPVEEEGHRPTTIKMAAPDPRNGRRRARHHPATSTPVKNRSLSLHPARCRHRRTGGTGCWPRPRARQQTTQPWGGPRRCNGPHTLPSSAEDPRFCAPRLRRRHSPCTRSRAWSSGKSRPAPERWWTWRR